MPITHGKFNVNFKIKGFRVVVDEANEKWAGRFVNHKHTKFQYQIVIGDQEQADGTVIFVVMAQKKQKSFRLKNLLKISAQMFANFSRVD